MSLRGHPAEERATLPDGREIVVRIGVPEDPYIKRKELDTVSLELFAGDVALAAVNTVLEPRHTGEARTLVREVVAALESGDLEPTAGAIEPFADRIPPVGETR
ncbi:MAG: hypothetical protein M3377_10970 [Actinomycetota bacterium]|nr:hypothetical protein [Actinomycetota bacterium]